jgi:hypothetical protein
MLAISIVEGVDGHKPEVGLRGFQDRIDLRLLVEPG